ncbi:hydroxymethylglutaryl-CoA lyase [Homoserinibacter sp. GY 40078]|uniref:hydroxymethylglutaryl-CoA lyase n=1 Tax=Homoserinibacter sp. GY 40078 TaxID=2603275 RepID=UPI0011CCCE6C|nr:hydroxymethylglutaryl-CoA lyase [Homoserinibacter sp. GY 40078]TXK18858.1 hydroxymethylglutaryl-CoA lyase [Homoserinibacter sp. GY 40078]
MSDAERTRPVWHPRPQPVADPSLPSRVRVYEVGPRDGLQAEPEILPADVKIELCRRLYASGLGAVELTSFVPARWIPQLADAEEVVGEVEVPEGARGVALVPNVRGLERALAAGVREVSVVVSATETFAQANLNTTLAGALDRAREVIAAASVEGVPVRGYLSMSFGDPWEGSVPIERVADLAAELHGAGAGTVALSDTIGTGTPGHVIEAVERTVAAGVSRERIALHLHDTYGQALGNVQAALRVGITEFDSSTGGLGRCPFAKGATGNLATEDLVWLLHGLGIETGVDLESLVRTSQWMSRTLGRPIASRVATALTAAGVS